MIYLASSSPRRFELLSTITKDFKVIKPTFDEQSISKKSPHYAMLEGFYKAKSVQKSVLITDCIIACDTIVVYKGLIYGKPKNKLDAFNTLKTLSGQTHKVISGYTIIYKEKVISKEITTEVTFNALSDSKINDYINNYNVMDKAGSYAIQDNQKTNIIKSIKGSLNNVIGFPLEEIKQDLINLKVI